MVFVILQRCVPSSKSIMLPKCFRLAIATVCIVLTFDSANAQDQLTKHTLKRTNPDTKVAVDLSKFAWIRGTWKGEGLGGECDEMWGPPAGGCMLGTFRMVSDAKLNFTEFFMLTTVDGQTVLKLKHFDNKFVGWETKDGCVTFPLIKVEGKAAYFEGLTYAIQKDGSLKAWVAMKKKDGSFDEAEIHFQKRD